MKGASAAGRLGENSLKKVLILALSAVLPIACGAQASNPLDWKGKLLFHARNTYGPLAITGFVAGAGVRQAIDAPEEWGQGGAAYGQRVASAAGRSAIRGTLAFGLDTVLHQDPRYHRSPETGFWSRVGHAVRGTVLTRTDAGGDTLSTWRLGSAYGSAYLSDLWYPDRLHTVRHGFVQGSMTLGFDLAGNLGSEFWPDIRRIVFRR
jgi:hypothetical protein